MYAIFFDAFEDGSRYVCRVIFPLDCVEKINASALYTTLFCDYCARRYHFFALYQVAGDRLSRQLYIPTFVFYPTICVYNVIK